MRKKTITHSCKTIFWYLLYFLPVLLTLIQSINIFSHFTAEQWSTSLIQTNYGKLLYENLICFGQSNRGFIIDVLTSIFGKSGILPLIDNNTIFMYFQYFVGVYLCHIAIDFILFIPRLCHKFMNKFTRSEDCE